MSQQQERITDSLINIIQAIQTGRGTGELRARRDDGSSSEIGSVIFVNGQIVAAQIGSYKGVVAFDMLKTWGRSVFIFAQNTPPPLSHRPPFETPSSSITGPQAPIGSVRPSITGIRPPTTGQQPPITSPQSSITGPQTLLPSQQQDRLQLTAVPRATMSILKARGIIEKAGLSRLHRQLVLLIDGQRSVSELTIAIGCPPQDMRQMLLELESLSIIRIPR